MPDVSPVFRVASFDRDMCTLLVLVIHEYHVQGNDWSQNSKFLQIFLISLGSMILDASTSDFSSSTSLRNLALLFWNHVIICAPDKPSIIESSSLSEGERYFWNTNRLSSSVICWFVKHVLGFLRFLWLSRAWSAASFCSNVRVAVDKKNDRKN